MILAKGALMSNDVLELPYNVIIIILCHVVHDLVVCHDIIIRIIIDVTSELDMGGGTINIVLMIFDSFNDAEVSCLSILLGDPNSPSN